MSSDSLKVCNYVLSLSDFLSIECASFHNNLCLVRDSDNSKRYES